jgi:hypothetical protein
MANIENITHAINRVRTILDRGNSPWMSDTEIRSFISMASNEFVRERVNIFGATQEIRDDLGDYVKTHEFGWTDISETSHWSNSGVNISVLEDDDEDADEDEIHFGYLLGIKIEKFSGIYEDEVFTDEYASSYFNCEVISLDEAQSILNDPFNKPEEGNYKAVKVGDIYYIMPSLEQETDESQNVITDYSVHVDFVADNNDDESVIIDRLPQHSREEVCQIAARKILGTIADERYPIGDAEIQQLNK